MKLWKKNPVPREHHYNIRRHESILDEVKSIKSQIDALTIKAHKQPEIELYTLDAGEDVLVSCYIANGEQVFVPLSQITARIEQMMMVKLSAKVRRGAVTAKSAKPEPEKETL